jgi:hypothetical protein
VTAVKGVRYRVKIRFGPSESGRQTFPGNRGGFHPLREKISPVSDSKKSPRPLALEESGQFFAEPVVCRVLSRWIATFMASPRARAGERRASCGLAELPGFVRVTSKSDRPAPFGDLSGACDVQRC